MLNRLCGQAVTLEGSDLNLSQSSQGSYWLGRGQYNVTSYPEISL